MKIAGIIILIFGIVDFAGSYAEFDLWGVIGVQLPDLVWTYSAYIEMALGYFVLSLGSKQATEEEVVAE